MSTQLINEQVDIYEFPDIDIDHQLKKGAQFTIGDLHANAIKLLFLLLKQGIAANITKAEYKELVSIYKTPVSFLNNVQFDRFNTIIDQVTVDNKAMLRLIGDEFSDRGSNDYFVLKVLAKLQQEKLPMEILISNHGVEFLAATEKKKQFLPSILYPMHSMSLINFNTLIEDKKFISRDEVLRLANDCYKPRLRAISYSISAEEITIYSHAPTGIEQIVALANLFNVEYQDNSPVQLAKTIDCINGEFQKYVQNNLVHTLYNKDIMLKGYSDLPINSCNSPLEFIMWNRKYYNLKREPHHKGYKINYAHGHDPSEDSEDNIYNLDNYLGKSLEHHVDQYTVLYNVTN